VDLHAAAVAPPGSSKPAKGVAAQHASARQPPGLRHARIFAVSRIVSAFWLPLPAIACSFGDTPVRRVLILCAACSNAGCPGGLPLKRIVQGYKRQQCKLALHCNTACESDAAD